MRKLLTISSLALLMACNREPEACIEVSNTRVTLGANVWLSNTCSKHQYRTIVDWYDGTIDTFENNKKGRSLVHFYDTLGTYLITVIEQNKEGDKEDRVNVVVHVLSPSDSDL